MRLLFKKLHSQRGASILMALVFFLLCGFVGAVVLGSATTNAQKIQDKRAEQQAYFAVSSAARLLRAEWGGSACEGWESEMVHGCNPWISGHSNTAKQFLIKEDGGEDAFITQENDNLLTRSAWKVFLHHAVYGDHRQAIASFPYEVDFSVTTEDPDFPEVAGKLSMEDNYNATVVLRIRDSDPADTANAITLRFQATVKGPEPATVKEGEPYMGEAGRCEYTVDDEEGNSTTDSKPKKTTIRTTTVVWGAGSIMKGAPKHA